MNWDAEGPLKAGLRLVDAEGNGELRTEARAEGLAAAIRDHLDGEPVAPEDAPRERLPREGAPTRF